MSGTTRDESKSQTEPVGDVLPRLGFMLGYHKILIVGINYWPEPSGNAPYTSYLARALSEKHNLKVLSTFPHYPWWKVPEGWNGNKQVTTDGSIELVRFRPWLPKSQSNLQRARLEIWFGLRAALSSWKKRDVVVLVSPAMLSSAVGMLKVKLCSPKTATVVWVQDVYTLGLEETQRNIGIAGRLVARVEKWLLKSADHVVVIHDRFRDVVLTKFEVNPKRVSVIRNWGQFTFSPSETSAESRTRFSWSDDDLVVLHTGNMGVKQGLDSLIELAKKLELRRPEIKFVLLGDGNQRPTLVELARNLGNVVFVDPVSEEELSNMLHAADIALVHEQTGVTEMAVPSKLTTYFTAGKPVIAVTDPGSITAEEVRNSKAGLSVSVGDSAKFCEAIDKLFEAKERFSTEAKNYAAAKLSGDEAVRKFEALISDLSDSRGKTL